MINTSIASTATATAPGYKMEHTKQDQKPYRCSPAYSNASTQPGPAGAESDHEMDEILNHTMDMTTVEDVYPVVAPAPAQQNNSVAQQQQPSSSGVAAPLQPHLVYVQPKPLPANVELEEFPDGHMRQKIVDLFKDTLPEFERQRPGYFAAVKANMEEFNFLALYSDDDDDEEEILAALCYQEQHPLNVAELHYFAVSRAHHRQGLGRRLMDAWKADLAQRGLQFIVTYADNTAIDFYNKTDFVKRSEMLLPEHVIAKRVDRCLNAVLMECNLQKHPKSLRSFEYCQRVLNVIRRDLDQGHEIRVTQIIPGKIAKGQSYTRRSKIKDVKPKTCWIKCHNGWYHMNSHRLGLPDRYYFDEKGPDPADLPAPELRADMYIIIFLIEFKIKNQI